MALARIRQIKWINAPILWTNMYLGLTRKKYLYIVLLLWIMNFIYDYVTSNISEGDSLNIRLAWAHFILGTPFILFLFFRFFPAFRGDGNLWVTLLQLLGIVSAILFCTHYLHVIWGLDPVLSDSRQMMSVYYRLMRFAGFAFLIWIISEYIQRLKRIRHIKGELAQVQISHDHLTLSPHLILNTLNNIAGKSAVYSNELFREVTAFSALLKESYKDPKIPRSIYDEVAILNHLLNCVRSHKSKFFLQLQVNYSQPMEYFTIPHLVLATLLENMLKYGLYTDINSPSEIRISLKTGPSNNVFLICSTFNLINPVKSTLSTGHGLPTIVNILKHHYGTKVFFEWHKSMDEFSTLMIITYGKIENSTD
ncbi:hypothetical protein PBT90_06190 [Algoriphagus halophytocola]|uniref:hypothetical protein n=1 Tax=Algoriphagus halophytocola TaxID=2991499 RepID=UPI0022DD0639|nr:hypothetical protein [Algoriphagus sp. TR-M9]WBL44274.1 hypothetical protein PBT90_06190 [Algoriphagus sp. TR-M9]